MNQLTKGVTRVLSILLIALMALIVLDVSWQVFTRFVLKSPSSFTEELAGFLLIWIGLLGAAYAYHTRAHLGIDILTYKLQGVRRRNIDVLVNLVVLLFAVFVLLVGGIRLVGLTFRLNQISPALGIQMGYVYLVLPLSGTLMVYYAVDFIRQSLSGEAVA